MIMAKNTLFVVILLYAAYYDYKHRIIPDKVHIIIMLLGVIHMNIADSLLGLLLVPLPVLIIGVIGGGIGGGDIKLIGVSSFFLGIIGGLYGTVLGLLMACIINVIHNLISSNKIKTFPLAPYLALGYMMVLLFLKIDGL